MQKGDERAQLGRLSAKELRRLAVLNNVPLVQVGAALEKTELVNLILRAEPVRDTYDVSLGSKVHSAESIRLEANKPKPAPKTAKERSQKGRRRSSSSSSRSSSSGSRGRRKRRPPKTAKRSSLAEESQTPHRGSRRPKRRPRSPSLEMVVRQTPGAARAGSRQDDHDDDIVLVSVRPASAATSATAAATSAVRRTRAAEALFGESAAEKGALAAAALGFDVLPKASPLAPHAPAEGLRPSITAGKPPAFTGAYAATAGRICLQYLTYSRCDLGSNCPEAHITDAEEEMRARLRFKQQECKFGASCPRAGCLFLHPGEIVDESRYIPESQQVVLKPTMSGMQVAYR